MRDLYENGGDFLLNQRLVMAFKNFVNGSLAIHLALFLGRILSLKVGHRLADWIGTWIARHSSYKMVQAVQANQYVVSGDKINLLELESRTRAVFQNVAHSLFDYYYYIRRPEKLKEIIRLSLKAQEVFFDQDPKQSAILLIPHLSNFDLMGHALSLFGIKVQILSFPTPNEAYKMQNKLREEVGVVVTPMSLSAFRTAKNRLNNGGYVVTGLDRPIPGDKPEKYRPKFFGREANLPVIHVRLAKETDASVYVMACIAQKDGTYILECSQAYKMEERSDLEEETILNAERLLAEAEKFIRKAPDQWAMFYPVWPEALLKIKALKEKV